MSLAHHYIAGQLYNYSDMNDYVSRHMYVCTTQQTKNGNKRPYFFQNSTIKSCQIHGMERWTPSSLKKTSKFPDQQRHYILPVMVKASKQGRQYICRTTTNRQYSSSASTFLVTVHMVWPWTFHSVSIGRYCHRVLSQCKNIDSLGERNWRKVIQLT